MLFPNCIQESKPIRQYTYLRKTLNAPVPHTSLILKKPSMVAVVCAGGREHRKNKRNTKKSGIILNSSYQLKVCPRGDWVHSRW